MVHWGQVQSWCNDGSELLQSWCRAGAELVKSCCSAVAVAVAAARLRGGDAATGRQDSVRGGNRAAPAAAPCTVQPPCWRLLPRQQDGRTATAAAKGGWMHGRASLARVAFGLGRSRAAGGAGRRRLRVCRCCYGLVVRRPGPATAGGGGALQGEEAAAGSGSCVRRVCHLRPARRRIRLGGEGSAGRHRRLAVKGWGRCKWAPVRFVCIYILTVCQT